MWTAIAVQVGLALVGAGIDYLFNNDDDEQDDRTPTEQEPYPVVSESDTIPVVFGVVRLTGPNVLWYGGPSHDDLRNRRVLNILMSWCHGPVDFIQKVEFGGRELNKSWPLDYSIEGDVSKDVLLEDDNGAIQMDGDLWFGTQTDPADWPTKRWDTYEAGGIIDPPGLGFRNLLLFAGNIIIDEGLSYESIAWTVRRTQVLTDGAAQWYSTKANSGTSLDINAIHVIRESLTDTIWGLGLDTSAIDDTSFQAAADTLHSEVFGISGVLTRETSIQDWIDGILELIDGEMYVEPTTGKRVIKLIRDDYTVGDLVTLDDSNCTGTFTRPSPHELPTRVTVKYNNPLKHGREQAYQLTNTAAYADRGEINKTIAARLITTASAAAQLAARSLRQLSSPLARVRISGAHRSVAKDLRKGDAFVWSSDEEGVDSMVCRVASIDFGTPTSHGVSIEAVEDAFSYEPAMWTPDGSTWTDPLNDPSPAPDRLDLELPLWLALQADLEVDPHAQATDYTSRTTGYAALAASRPTDDAIDYDLYTESSTKERGADFATVIASEYAVAQDDTTIRWSDGTEFDESRDALLQIGIEIVLATSINNSAGVMTVERGWGDTVPKYNDHPAGSSVYLLGYLETEAGHLKIDRTHAIDRTAWDAGDVIDLRALTRTPLGTLAVADAPSDTLEMDSRTVRPLAPHYVSVTDNSDTVEFTGSVDIAWKHRSRFDDPVTESDATSQTLESGATYTLRIYGEADGSTALLRTETGLTGESYSYTNANEISDNAKGCLSQWLIFYLEAHRTDGGTDYRSWQIQQRRIDRASTGC